MRQRTLAAFGGGLLLLLLAGAAPAAAPFAERPSVGGEINSFRPLQLVQRLSDPASPDGPGGLNDPSGSGAERQGAVRAVPAQRWDSWRDLPGTVPPNGYPVPGQPAVGGLSPDSFPGVVIRKSRNAGDTGPPRSLDILNQSTNELYKEAVKAVLIGPDHQLFAEYARSPDGRYVLELPPDNDIPGGRFEIRILIDGAEATVVRRISIDTNAVARPEDNPGHLNVYVSKESIDRSTRSGYASPRITFEADAEGEKLLRAGISEIDRALVHAKESYEALDARAPTSSGGKQRSDTQ